jgi:hypothetical protein
MPASRVSSRDSKPTRSRTSDSRPIYIGLLGRITYEGTLFEFGGGFDYLVYKGLGVGASLGLAGGQSTAALFPSLDVSYHFIPKSRRVVPFVMAGVGAIGVEGEAGTTLNLGGGANIWTGHGTAFRIQVRVRFEPEYGENTIALQFGMTF